MCLGICQGLRMLNVEKKSVVLGGESIRKRSVYAECKCELLHEGEAGESIAIDYPQLLR